MLLEVLPFVLASPSATGPDLGYGSPPGEGIGAGLSSRLTGEGAEEPVSGIILNEPCRDLVAPGNPVSGFITSDTTDGLLIVGGAFSFDGSTLANPDPEENDVLVTVGGRDTSVGVRGREMGA